MKYLQETKDLENLNSTGNPSPADTNSGPIKSDSDSVTNVEQDPGPISIPKKNLNSIGLQFLSLHGAENTLVLLHFFMSAWGIGILLWMYKTVGWWPLVSYTMFSWTLSTVRWVITFNLLVTRKIAMFVSDLGIMDSIRGIQTGHKKGLSSALPEFLGPPVWVSRMIFGSQLDVPLPSDGLILSVEQRLATLSSSASPAERVSLQARVFISQTSSSLWSDFYVGWIENTILIPFSELTRFPCIAQHIMTFVVWWLVLVPIICLLQAVTGKSNVPFLKFNASFFLINVHIFNTVIGLLDHAMITPRPLDYWDLCYAFGFGMGYLAFYLAFLDANGIHFYVILNPRTKLAALSYMSIMLFYVGIFAWWR